MVAVPASQHPADQTTGKPLHPLRRKQLSGDIPASHGERSLLRQCHRKDRIPGHSMAAIPAAQRQSRNSRYGLRRIWNTNMALKQRRTACHALEAPALRPAARTAVPDRHKRPAPLPALNQKFLQACARMQAAPQHESVGQKPISGSTSKALCTDNDGSYGDDLAGPDSGPATTGRRPRWSWYTVTFCCLLNVSTLQAELFWKLHVDSAPRAADHASR